MRIALATWDRDPDLHADDRILARALARAGVDALPTVWTDARVDWRAFDAVVVRSTWDYTFCPDEFLAWIDRVAPVTRLLNDPEVLRWNAHKRYLGELAAHGVAVVPTVYVGDDSDDDFAPTRVRRRGWDEVVVKPCISAGARDTLRVPASDVDAAIAKLRALGKRDLMVQPYQRAVETVGERSLVHFGGVFSHAVRKHPQLVDGLRFDDPPPAAADPDELAAAQQILSLTPVPTLYARVDLVRGSDGKPQLMELEAIEPRLFFTADESAADRCAAAIIATIR